jgi:hypothetical protein
MNGFFAAIEFLQKHPDVTGKVETTSVCYGGGTGLAMVPVWFKKHLHCVDLSRKKSRKSPVEECIVNNKLLMIIRRKMNYCRLLCRQTAKNRFCIDNGAFLLSVRK